MSYAREIFSAQELRFYDHVYHLVKALFNRGDKIEGEWIRCHEMAEAIGRKVDLPVAHGMYSSSHHSWLWTKQPDDDEIQRFKVDHCWRHASRPKIIEVYSVAKLPECQLIDPFLDHGYRLEWPLDVVINLNIVDRIKNSIW